jgi:hypothetical protein
VIVVATSTPFPKILVDTNGVGWSEFYVLIEIQFQNDKLIFSIIVLHTCLISFNDSNFLIDYSSLYYIQNFTYKPC